MLILPTAAALSFSLHSTLFTSPRICTKKESTKSNMDVTFHVVGDAYVDFFSFLDGDWPENGGDSRLEHPVKSYAGGSSTNTATHLKALSRNFGNENQEIVLHTVLNPSDHYGKLLLDHAKKHGFPLVNCRKTDDDESWTGHCIAIVSGGERSFMTHQGCVEKFAASDLHVEKIIETDGPIHLHVAGYFNVTGFWNGNLKDQLVYILEERKKKFPNQTTTVSLVTQHDASKGWDGGLDDVIPYLDFIIMNELEANRIVRRGRGGIELDPSSDPVQEWLAFFSGLNPEAVVVVTKVGLTNYNRAEQNQENLLCLLAGPLIRHHYLK